MRYYELLGAPTSPTTASETRSTFSGSSAPCPPQKVKLIIGLMPAVYKELPLQIEHGGPDASIGTKSASVRFNEPYDQEGRVSQGCRNWIEMVVQEAATELGRSMWIVFAEDDVIHIAPDGDDIAPGLIPQGGLWLRS